MNENQHVFYKNILCNLVKKCLFKSLFEIYQKNKSLYNYNKLIFYIKYILYNKPSSYVQNGVLHTLIAEIFQNNNMIFSSYTTNTFGIKNQNVPKKAKVYKIIDCNNIIIKLYDYS
jgi:hypothetical protein